MRSPFPPFSVVLLTLPFLLLAACGTGPGPAQKGTVPLADGEPVPTTTPHVMPLLDDLSRPDTAPRGAMLDYNGGPVLSNVKVVQVLFGAAEFAPEVLDDSMGRFYQAATNSSYFTWLAEYNTDTHYGTQQIGPGQFIGRFTITPSASNSGQTLTDPQIQAELSAQITAGNLPAADPNVLYMVHFAKGVKIAMRYSGGSCASGGFCAYHGSYALGGQNVYYGVLPDMSPGSGCEAPHCGADPLSVNNLTTVASHELVEAVTDADVGARHLAWLDHWFGEIGDICVGQAGTFQGPDGVTYMAQKQYSNHAQDCIMGRDAGL